MPAKIIFLGVGGGRFVVVNQIRASGGWILQMDGETMHVDPGPGALVRAKQYGVKLEKLTGVIVSHAHPDHYADAEMVIEAMTEGTKKKRGFVIGDSTVFRGSRGFHPVVSSYHMKAAERCCEMKPGDRVRPGKSGLEIEAVATKHGDPNGLGFAFRGSCAIGFSGDGGYYKGQGRHFQGADCLLISCLRPRGMPWPGHMDAGGALRLVEEARPAMVVLHHFGTHMLKGIAEREANWIGKQSGVRTVAARDGMELDVGGSGKAAGKGDAGIGRFLK